jgi:hypothetical protein
MSAAAPVPRDMQDAPDLQALVQQCGGYHLIHARGLGRLGSRGRGMAGVPPRVIRPTR